MLQIMDGRQIATDKYYIRHMADGMDELHFTVAASDPVYMALREEDRILETTEGQIYTVKSFSGGSTSVSVGCRLDLSDWQSSLLIGYNSLERTAQSIVNSLLPSGWQLISLTQSQKKRTVEMQGPTPLEVVSQVLDTFGCAVRYSTAQKTVTLLYPEDVELSNSYVVDSVNLRKCEYKGKSTNLYTRLYAYGKETDGVPLSFASINGGKPYVENFAYTDDIICEYWSDSRYTNAESLLEDAQAKVDAAAVPERSWTLDVVDLFRCAPEKWPDMRLDIFTKLRLVDNDRGFSADVLVVEDRVYPYYPEENRISVSAAAKSVQRTLRGLYAEIHNQNSAFYQKLLK